MVQCRLRGYGIALRGHLSILAIVFGAMAVFSFMLAFIIAVCKEFSSK